MNNEKNRPERFIVLVGNIGDGHTAVGPYESIEEAFEAHSGDECWVMTLHEPDPISESNENVFDIFDYQKNWQPDEHKKG